MFFVSLDCSRLTQAIRLGTLIVGVAVLGGVGAHVRSQEAGSGTGVKPKGAVQDAITDKDLKDQMAAAAKANAQKGPIGKPAVPTRAMAPVSILDRSHILGDGAHFTLVPKGAVLHVPPAHKSKVFEKPAGVFLSWPAFLKQNQSWLAAREVTMKMASGQDAKRIESLHRELASGTKVIVAVFKGNPICIMEQSASTRETSESSALDPGSSPPANP